jgi:hypothetical protein
MFTTILLTVVLAAAFFSAENIVTVIIGGLASMGISQWLKNSTGAYGPAMLILAVIVSVIVGFAALVVSSFWSGHRLEQFAALRHTALRTGDDRLQPVSEGQR